MTSSLETLQNYSAKIGLPAIVCISLIGNTLNIAVLSRYKFRKHACTLYFIALSINNLIYSTSVLIISLLGDGYKIRLTMRSLILCKLVTYFGTLLSALSSSFIILASIDRWLASSSSVKRRLLSDIRRARWLIIGVTLFFSHLFIISFIRADIDKNAIIGCRIRGELIFDQIYNTFHFIYFALLAPILMLLFGCMTICNVKQSHKVSVRSARYRRIEKQLFRMLVIQVGFQILFTLPICIVGLLGSFPRIYTLDKNFYDMFILARVIFQTSYVSPFFLYIISSRNFRQELIRLIHRIALCQRSDRVRMTRRRNVLLRLDMTTLIHASSL